MIIRLYEHHFPWLDELRDPDAEAAYLAGPTNEAAGEENQDPVRHWLSDQEYASLSPAERNQRSLDRYLASRKSPWELGPDYERYIGYLCERAGGKVTYQGISRDWTTSAATWLSNCRTDRLRSSSASAGRAAR